MFVQLNIFYSILYSMLITWYCIILWRDSHILSTWSRQIPGSGVIF